PSRARASCTGECGEGARHLPSWLTPVAEVGEPIAGAAGSQLQLPMERARPGPALRLPDVGTEERLRIIVLERNPPVAFRHEEMLRDVVQDAPSPRVRLDVPSYPHPFEFLQRHVRDPHTGKCRIEIPHQRPSSSDGNLEQMIP